MRHAIIEDGKVTNVALAEPDFALEQGWVKCNDEVSKGWSYDGSVFTAPEIIENPVVDVAATIPQPTKEELLAQLQALTEQVQSLT